MQTESTPQPLQYARNPPASAGKRRMALGLSSCAAAAISYGVHALQFWPANPFPVGLFVLGGTLGAVGLLLAILGLIDKRERHWLDVVGLLMNMLSFAVPASLLR